jgi:hypothetical protein
MKRLVELLPTDDEIEFSKTLGRLNIDSRKIMGEDSFNQLKTYCKYEGCAMERAAGRATLNENTLMSNQGHVHATSNVSAGRESTVIQDSSASTTDKYNQKTAAKVSAGMESTVIQDSSASTMITTNLHAVNLVQNGQTDVGRFTHNFKKDWANPKWQTPCGLGRHNHELVACRDFFSLTPQQRRDQTKGKVCWTCFSPRQECVKVVKTHYGKMKVMCSNYQRVKPLICKDCSVHVQENNMNVPPLNVMFCSHQNHLKPSENELSKLLKEYFPTLDVPNVCSTSIDHLSASSASSMKAMSITPKTRSAMSGWGEDVTINSNSGQKSVNVSSLIVPEKTNPVIYIMQWFQIGESKCLCLFDTGANINMIDGRLAETEELQVISHVPTTLKVVGGSKLVTDYGTYKLNLGPTHAGKYHELTCHGMNSVTDLFPMVNLKEVNKEVKGFSPDLRHAVLPEFVGGSVVHLLLGLGNTATQPALLYTLPSGISVYQSPFTDIFGSNICYGGSHSSFNSSVISPGSNHTILHINTICNNGEYLSNLSDAGCNVKTVGTSEDQIFRANLDHSPGQLINHCFDRVGGNHYFHNDWDHYPGHLALNSESRVGENHYFHNDWDHYPGHLVLKSESQAYSQGWFSKGTLLEPGISEYKMLQRKFECCKAVNAKLESVDKEECILDVFLSKENIEDSRLVRSRSKSSSRSKSRSQLFQFLSVNCFGHNGQSSTPMVQELGHTEEVTCLSQTDQVLSPMVAWNKNKRMKVFNRRFQDQDAGDSMPNVCMGTQLNA